MSVQPVVVDEQCIVVYAGDGAFQVRTIVQANAANPRNDAARLRIANLVYERSVEAEQKGAREQELTLCEQAASLRGKPVSEWTARARSLRKALSAEYYERGMRVFRTDIASAITLWEASLRYDPQNRSAQIRLQEARVASERLKRIERERQLQ